VPGDGLAFDPAVVAEAAAAVEFAVGVDDFTPETATRNPDPVVTLRTAEVADDGK